MEASRSGRCEGASQSQGVGGQCGTLDDQQHLAILIHFGSHRGSSIGNGQSGEHRQDHRDQQGSPSQDHRAVTELAFHAGGSRLFVDVEAANNEVVPAVGVFAAWECGLGELPEVPELIEEHPATVLAYPTYLVGTTQDVLHTQLSSFGSDGVQVLP